MCDSLISLMSRQTTVVCISGDGVDGGGVSVVVCIPGDGVDGGGVTGPEKARQLYVINTEQVRVD